MFAASGFELALLFFIMSSTCPQLGFTVHLTPRSNLEASARAELHDALLACIDARALSRSGGYDAAEWSYVVWREGSQADDLDREAIRAWAAERAELASMKVGLLYDVKGESE
jgi:uncharacterized protein YggL (DUF469 family)